MLSLALSALLTFHDVPKTSWAYPDVVLLASAGAMHGETDGLFQPVGDVSREQAAATLARALGLPAATMPAMRDAASVSKTLSQDVARAVAAGILRGTAQGYLQPHAVLTRAAAAALIARAFSIAPAQTAHAFRDAATIPAYAAADVNALAAAGIVEGDAQGDFQPNRPVTRAEWAALLLRAVIVHGGAPGLKAVVAGNVSALYPPDDPALAAQSPLGGTSGALSIGGRTLDLAKGAMVFRQGALADYYALSSGDQVAAWLAPDGTVGIVEDLALPASQPDSGTVADVSASSLYLDTGAVLSGTPVTLLYQGGQVSLAALPAYLLYAQVTAQAAGGALHVSVQQPYAFDLQGTITAVGNASLTLRLTSSSALLPLVPGLSAGSEVQIDLGGPGATVTGVGANAPSAPAVGLSAQVMGYVEGSGAVAAGHVILSQ